MILNKYSKAKENNSAPIGSYSSRSNSSSSSSGNRSLSLDREIWGQEDDGDDLNGDLTCEGNMYVIDNWDDGENDDEDEDEDENGYAVATVREEPIMPMSDAEDLQDKFDNTEGGNLYVKRQLVVDKEIITPDCYGKTIYLDYPDRIEGDGNKTDLLTILKNHETQINNGGTGGSGNGMTEEMVRNIVESMLPKIKYGSDTQPVVLMAGKLAESYLRGIYNFSGSKSDCVQLEPIELNDGLMKITLKPKENFSDLRIVAVNVTQSKSGDTEILSNVNLYNRNAGAHWFEARPQYIGNGENCIYLREFHQADQDKDTWASNDWHFKYDESVFEIDFVVFGYAVPQE